MHWAMPSLNRLSDRFIKTTKVPGRHGDGNGLYLHVDKPGEGRPGAKRWVLVYHLEGKRREMGLGSVRTVGLADARTFAAAAQSNVAKGIDPRTAKAAQEVKKPTFAEVAAVLLSDKKSEWRGRKTEARWNLAITGYAEPFCNKPVDEITTDEVLAVLRPIWTAKPETAQKVRSVFERVFDAAKARGFRFGDNPARWVGHLKLLLSKPIKLSRGHHPALPVDDAPYFFANLVEHPTLAARALELTVLTVVRTTVALEVTWSEVDLDGRVWSIPIERMKNFEELKEMELTHFRMPLSDAAANVFRKVLAAVEGVPNASSYVFPGPEEGSTLSYNAMRALMLKMGYNGDLKATVHGFRSTFSDWGTQQSAQLPDGRTVRVFTEDLLEWGIGHVVGSPAARAYKRYDMFDERKPLMDEWAAYLTSKLDLRSAETPETGPRQDGQAA